MIHHVDNVGLAVTNLNAALDFYRRLGFKDTPAGDNSASLSCGEATLYLFQTTSQTPVAKRSSKLLDNPPGLDHVSFWVGDVDAAATHLIETGIRLEQPPADQPWGRRTATVLDPDGNRIWLLGELANRR